MKATLIKKDDSYYLSTEKQTDLCYHLEHKEILKVKGVGENSGEVHHNKGWNKSDEVLFINTEVKLSIKNCDDIFGVVDVDKLAMESSESQSLFNDLACYETGFIRGFNKAMELNKDKVFTLRDVERAILWAHDKSTEGVYLSRLPITEFIQSLQQPTEMDVEIVMEKVYDGLDEMAQPQYYKKPKLDADECLILKRI